jgi:3-hydroxyisobutyrate dehydrogenase
MNIALIGTGLMGQALVEHLLNEQQTITVYNRTQEKLTSSIEKGAVAAESAELAIANSDYILFMLSDAAAINSVLDTVDNTVLNNKLFIQMGTIAPEESRHIAARLQQFGAKYIECPVLGSLPEARTGTLILMAGGAQSDYESALPILNLIGNEPKLIGGIGQGATVKLAMNQLIAGLTASFSLSLALVEKENIDIEQFMTIVRESALYAPTFDKKLDRMLERNFDDPNFPTKHLAKDTRLFLSVAEQLGLETCGLQGVSELIDKTLAQGLDNTDYSALMAAVSPK